jgi:FtsP/CotA-like multicopper oxidase with cupredoxin domain
VSGRRAPVRPRPDREFFLCFHSFTPLATGLDNQFSCINGRAYAGNTPTLRAKVGETVAWHVFALDDDFHAFHLHGHRWVDPDGGRVIDNETLGPGDVISLQYVEDNPGRWFYHCHVFSHLHMGMNGWYIVSP